MKLLFATASILFFAVCLAPIILAQESENTSKPAEKTSANKPATTNEKQTRALEAELVRKIKKLLGNMNPDTKARKKNDKQEAPKAEIPEPVRHDSSKISSQLEEWKSKIIAVVDMLEAEKQIELQNEYSQKYKNLEEKARKAERVVLNPKRRPPSEEQIEKLEEAFEKEINRLTREYDAKSNKIGKEFEKEKASVSRLAKELERALKSALNRSGKERKNSRTQK